MRIFIDSQLYDICVQFKKLFIIGMLITFGACSTITPKVDEKTQTTLAQRCVDYRFTVEALKLRREGGNLNDEEKLLLTLGEAWVLANCPRLPE